jgi:hypothetical protein
VREALDLEGFRRRKPVPDTPTPAAIRIMEDPAAVEQIKKWLVDGYDRHGVLALHFALNSAVCFCASLRFSNRPKACLRNLRPS